MIDSNDIYPVSLILSAKKNIALWYTDKEDGFFLDDIKRIKIFNDLDAAYFFLSEKGLNLLHREIAEYDFDSLESWIIDTTDNDVDCDKLLNFWNMFIDIYAATGKKYGPWKEIGEPVCNEYEKLFYGCSLPAIIPDEEQFIPVWKSSEVDFIRKVMSVGLDMLKHYI